MAACRAYELLAFHRHDQVLIPGDLRARVPGEYRGYTLHAPLLRNVYALAAVAARCAFCADLTIRQH
jgi:hypothetical protein